MRNPKLRVCTGVTAVLGVAAIAIGAYAHFVFMPAKMREEVMKNRALVPDYDSPRFHAFKSSDAQPEQLLRIWVRAGAVPPPGSWASALTRLCPGRRPSTPPTRAPS